MTDRRQVLPSVYYRWNRVVDGGLRALRGVSDGIWLGVLSRSQLSRIDEHYYRRAAEYTTESYNQGGLFPWEHGAVDKYFGDVHRIVVTSAGAGREVLALARAGHEVTGYEPHPHLAAEGNRLLAAAGVDASIRVCDRDRWPDGTPEADGVVAGWGGYMLIAGRSRRVAFLRGAVRSLPAGAPVLVSFAAVSGHDIRLRTAARLANLLRRVAGREPVALGDAMEPTYIHCFTRPELEAELSEAGLDLAEFGTDGYGWAVGHVRCHR